MNGSVSGSVWRAPERPSVDRLPVLLCRLVGVLPHSADGTHGLTKQEPLTNTAIVSDTFFAILFFPEVMHVLFATVVVTASATCGRAGPHVLHADAETHLDPRAFKGPLNEPCYIMSVPLHVFKDTIELVRVPLPPSTAGTCGIDGISD
jgi:hypothetical protein